MPPRPPRSAHTQKHTAPAHTLRTPVARLRTQKNTSPQTHTQVQKPQSITRPRAPRALLPILIAGICIAGVFAASPVFFPTNPPASLTPDDTTASGTLGHALSFFDSDGTAPNTEKLGGTPASEFLQVHPSCGAGEVWKGIGTSGKPLCGFVTTPLVMEMRLLSGSIRLNGTERKAPYSFSAQGTDRIETGKDRATLQFVADASLLRLDKQTSITLGYGANSDGQTVAQTVLERGVLWGRVLTGTGMNFGHGGFVAGVRGTGIKFGIREDGKLTVAVPHSRSQGFKTLPGMGDVTVALDMTCKNANGAPKSLGLLLGDERVYDTANCSEITLQKKSGIQTLYDTDRWIAENVIEDIMYINSILADAQAHDTKKQAATAEKTITIPTTPAEKNALCAAGETYWEQFENSATIPVCSKTLAYVDFSAEAGVNRGKMMYRNEDISALNTKDQGALNGQPISFTGHHTRYAPAITHYGYLNGTKCQDNHVVPDPSKPRGWNLASLDFRNEKLLPGYYPQYDSNPQAKEEIKKMIQSLKSAKWPSSPGSNGGITRCTIGIPGYEHDPIECRLSGNPIFYYNADQKPKFPRLWIGTVSTCSNNIITTNLTNGISFYKIEPPALASLDSVPSIYTDNGVNIYEQNAIIYNLTDIAQSSIGNLAGKTIEIEFEDMGGIHKGSNTKMLIYLTKGVDNLYKVYYNPRFSWGCGDISCPSSPVDGNKVQITLPQDIDTSAGTLYIGNNQAGTRPVDTIIKAVRILQ